MMQRFGLGFAAAALMIGGVHIGLLGERAGPPLVIAAFGLLIAAWGRE
jgi:hypothetical protein